MALIVQKYGGTSVGNPERILNVARRVIETQSQGNQVVVVVSAMSGVTDNLIKLARDVSPNPSEREMDVLLATGEQTTIALRPPHTPSPRHVQGQLDPAPSKAQLDPAPSKAIS